MTIDLVIDKPLLHPVPNQPFFHQPILVLYSEHIAYKLDVDKIWTDLGTPGKVATHRFGKEIGHFLVHEAEDECVEVTCKWLEDNWGASPAESIRQSPSLLTIPPASR